MNKKFGVLLALIVISLSSCITIEEIYTFKKDGSGNMKYVIDMGEMMSLMKSMAGDSDEPTETDTMLGSVGNDFISITELLKGINGVSNINHSSDDEKFIYSVSFDFKDITVLNNALNEMFKDSTQTGYQQFFTQKGKKLDRNSLIGNKMKAVMGTSEDKEMMEPFLDQMKYNMVFNFEDGVKSVKTLSTAGKLSSDKKTYSVKTDFKKLTTKDDLLSASFKLN